ncbi:MAG: SlyX family protein [Devosiaceae bacterium]|nr:SlyX family protein [Devosiaceae bacterium]
MDETGSLDAKIDALETRIAFQDETIEDLNKTVTDQWDEFNKLRREISRLSGQVQQMQSSKDGSDGNEPPPHY